MELTLKNIILHRSKHSLRNGWFILLDESNLFTPCDTCKVRSGLCAVGTSVVRLPIYICDHCDKALAPYWLKYMSIIFCINILAIDAVGGTDMDGNIYDNTNADMDVDVDANISNDATYHKVTWCYSCTLKHHPASTADQPYYRTRMCCWDDTVICTSCKSQIAKQRRAHVKRLLIQQFALLPEINILILQVYVELCLVWA